MLPLPSPATPLVYAAFAAGLLWLTRRWVRPLSLRSAVVLALLPLAFVGPALLTGRVYGPIDLAYMTEPLESLRADVGVEGLHSHVGGDVVFQMIPWRKAVRTEIEQGRWPLWNRFMLSGDILAGSAVAAPYHPVHVLGYLLPLGPSFTFLAAAVLLLAALSSFLYSREVGCSEGAALVGAGGWMASGFLLFWLQWPHALTVAVFPLVLLGARRAVRRPEPRAVVLLALAMSLVLLAGHPESGFHVVAVAALYGVVELLWVRRRPWRVLGVAVASGLLALGITAVYLLPFVEALPQSQEYGERSASFAQQDRSVSWPESLRRLRVNALPFVYGLPWREEAPAEDPFFVPLSSAYVGSCLFPWILFGLWRHPWRGRWLLLGMVLLGLLSGASSPGVADLLAKLPLFDISINKRLVFVAGFALSALAALGVDAWRRQRRWRELVWLSAAVAGGLFLLVAIQWPGLRATGLSSRFLLERSAIAVAGPWIVAGLTAMARRPRLVFASLILLLVGQRVLERGAAHPVFDESAFFPPIPPLARLAESDDIFRVVGQGATLLPNTSALYELEDVRGYQGMYLERAAWTHPLWCRPRPALFFCQVDDPRRPFLSFLNVRYALVANWEPVPVGWPRVARTRGFSIYENPDVIERIFVPDQVWLDVQEERVWAQMSEASDFRAEAWIETRPQPGGPSAGGERIPNGPGTLGFERLGNGYRIEAAMEKPGWVVISETAWKGWRARSEGEPLPLAFANRGYLALHLESGEHSVELLYRPASFVLGAALSTLSLIVLVVVGLLDRRRAGVRAVSRG